MLTYSSTFTGSIAAGQSVDMVSDGTWTPSSGKYDIQALVDDVHRVPETDRANDTLDGVVVVP